MSERAALFFLVFSIRKWSPREWPEAGKWKYVGAEAASPGGPGGAGVENLVGKCPIVEQTFATPVRNRHSSWFFCALSHVRQNFSSPAPHLHCHHPGRNHCHLSRSPCFSPSATAVLLTAEPMLLKWEREPVCRQPTNFQRLLIPHRTRCRILPLLGLQAPMIGPQPGGSHFSPPFPSPTLPFQQELLNLRHPLSGLLFPQIVPRHSPLLSSIPTQMLPPPSSLL